MPMLTRRRALMLGTGVAVALSPLAAAPARAANDTAEVIKAFLAGKEPVAGKLTVDLPEIAENGNTVPLAFTVDSPMTEASHVTEVVVLAEANPTSSIAKFRFTPSAGKVDVSLRVRLAATQWVHVLARTSDGAVYMEKKSVKVTIAGSGGCSAREGTTRDGSRRGRVDGTATRPVGRKPALAPALGGLIIGGVFGAVVQPAPSGRR